MNDLKKVYRKAPTLKSPASLDHRVLRAAKARNRTHTLESQPKAERLSPGWRRSAYAVSILCMFGIGLGVLLEAGMVGNGLNGDLIIDSSPVASVETARSGDIESSVGLDSTSADAAQLESQSQPVRDALLAETVAAVPLVAETMVAETRVADNMVVDAITADSDASGEVAVNVAPSALVDALADEQADDLADVQVDSPPKTDSATARVLTEPEIQPEARSSTAVAGLSQEKSRPAAASVDRSNSNRTAARSSAGKSVNKRATRIRSTEWLTEQNPNGYTVQLAPFGDKATLFLIADNLPVLTDQLRVDPESWVLLYGSFTDQSSAEFAMIELIDSVARLPQVTALFDPKIVSFREISQRIK